MSRKALCCILFLLCITVIPALRDIICHDPDAGGTIQNKDRKFLILGADHAGGAGFGNLLIFYPAAFYFAAVTGRDIIISDGSIIGEMCSIIQCGFPFVSQLSLAFPKILNSETLSNVEEVKAVDFGRYMEESKDINPTVVRASGYQPKSDWWLWYNTTLHCVKKLTGCDLGDVTCTERHAYQRLIRGPFKAGLTLKEEDRIHGVPDNLKHAILTLPHAYAPRLDFAIHLRTQFHHFEQQTDANDTSYVKEVSDWMAGEECQSVFQAIEDKLVAEVEMLRPSNTETSSNRRSLQIKVEGNNPEYIYVYLAADNEDVKESLASRLSNRTEIKDKVKFMRVKTQFIFHVKNLAKLKKDTNNAGLLDLVFDWYALSLANNIFSWRKGSTSMVSTFVHSAQKVSGTTERTDNTLGRGIGTRGWQLLKDRHGRFKFDLFWVYTFLEDFQIRRKI